jgi:hypothetical protein
MITAFSTFVERIRDKTDKIKIRSGPTTLLVEIGHR